MVTAPVERAAVRCGRCGAETGLYVPLPPARVVVERVSGPTRAAAPADGLLSASEAAKRLGRSPDHIYRLIRSAGLKATVEGGSYRIRERELTRYIDSLERPVGRARKAS